MPKYSGGCHCGRVRFTAVAEPTHLTSCNCSLCARKGALYIRLAELQDFQIERGESELRRYRFHTETATHYFCRQCGVHTFHRSRFDPERWSVNARCLDNFDVDAFEVVEFDGQNWQTAARSEGWSDEEEA